MDTGFNYYHGADPSEYDLVLSNSEGGLTPARARRAPAGRSSGARTPSSSRRSRWREMDVFFYGYGDSSAGGRRRWSASRAGRRRRSTSRSAGGTSETQAAHARSATFRSTSSRGRSRRRGSTPRDAPLARRCRSPHLPAVQARLRGRRRPEPPRGIEQWFEPGQIIVVEDGTRHSATGAPRRPGRGGRDGRPRPRACPRRAHTYAHRRRVLDLLGLSSGVPA